jgi:hypothetical protein
MATVDLRCDPMGRFFFRVLPHLLCVTMNSLQLESMRTTDVPAATHAGCISNQLPQRIQVEAGLTAVPSSLSRKHRCVDDHAAIRYTLDERQSVPGDGVPLVC